MKIHGVLCALTPVVLTVAAGMCTDGAAYAAAKQTSAEAAIKAAAAKHRYVVVTFYKKSDAASDWALEAVRSSKAKLSARADFATADVGSQANQALLKRYGLNAATVPITLVIAPNGAVTGGISGRAEPDKVKAAFVSDGMANVLKVLQSGKIVLVCVQNGKTKLSKESLKAATAFKADSRLPGAVDIVKIDPSNRAEAKFLGLCKVDPKGPNAQIVMIAPSGMIVGRFPGQTTKDTMYASLQTALKSSSGCGPGASPGCCPR